MPIFLVSKLEELIKVHVRMVHLANLQGELEKGMEGYLKMVEFEERMWHLEIKMGENMERIIKLIQKPEEKLPKGDDMA